jgi:hypothetical protein
MQALVWSGQQEFGRASRHVWTGILTLHSLCTILTLYSLCTIHGMYGQVQYTIHCALYSLYSLYSLNSLYSLYTLYALWHVWAGPASSSPFFPSLSASSLEPNAAAGYGRGVAADADAGTDIHCTPHHTYTHTLILAHYTKVPPSLTHSYSYTIHRYRQLDAHCTPTIHSLCTHYALTTHIRYRQLDTADSATRGALSSVRRTSSRAGYGVSFRELGTTHCTLYTIHHTPYTIHHTPYTHTPIHHTPIHPYTHTPYTMHHTPYTTHHTPYTIYDTNHGIHHIPY